MRSRLMPLALITMMVLLGPCPLLNVYGYPRSFAVTLGDVDGDGDLDAFVANGHTDGDDIRPNMVWLNDGSGKFADSGQRLGGWQDTWSDSRAVALGDVDGDDDLDAFVGNYNGGSKGVWINSGTVIFALNGQTNLSTHPSWGKSPNVASGGIPSTSNSVAVALGDVDGDGDLDVYVGDCCRTTSVNGEGSIGNVIKPYNTVWLNDGTGKFGDSGQRLGPSETHAVALGDVDGDGDLDTFVGNKGQPNKVWLNDGMAKFTNSGQELGSSDSYAVALGDLDSDGDLDAFVGNNGANEIWLNDGTGYFTETRQRLGSSNTRVVTLEDLDSDGDLDAFVGNSTTAKIWSNDGSGRFSDSGQNLAYSNRHVVTLGDVDGDGDLDVFAGSFDRGYQVWRNDGAGHFGLGGRQRTVFPWLAGGSAVVVLLGLCVFWVVRRR